MIPSSAIDAYLNRKLDNHLWIKKLSLAELNAAIDQLNPKPDLHPKVRKHQRACFLLGVSYPQFCYWLSMGTGKTLLAFELLKYWFKVGRIKRAIIFVKSDKAFSTWERQLSEFNVGLPLIALSGSSEEKWRQLEEFGEGLVLVAYPGAVAMSCERVGVKGKAKFKISPKAIKRLAKWADAFVLDESTAAANRGSVVHKMVAKLKKYAKVRYALAGRPLGRDPTMLWGQYNLIDDGATLGETVGLFRAAFFTEKPCYWDPKGYAKEYTFNKKMKPVLSQMMCHRSITYSAPECVDMPKKVPIIEEVKFSEEAEAYYKRMIQRAIEAKGNLREMENVFLRMRQISSGFVGMKDDKTGERAEIEFMENPKLDRLLELIEEVPEGYGACVFYEFTRSGRKIVEALKEKGHKPIWLWSGTKDSRKELDKFFNAEQPLAVINNGVGAYSLDGLQRVASYDFEFESPLSVIAYDQARARLERDGQKHTVFQYSLQVKGTVDSKIRAYHQEGEELFKTLMRDPAKVLDAKSL